MFTHKGYRLEVLCEGFRSHIKQFKPEARELGSIRSASELLVFMFRYCETATCVSGRWSNGDFYVDVGQENDYSDMIPFVVLRRVR